jgi:hypothetical protein
VGKVIQINRNTNYTTQSIRSISYKVFNCYTNSCTLTILCIKCPNSSKSLSCDYEGQAYRRCQFLQQQMCSSLIRSLSQSCKQRTSCFHILFNKLNNMAGHIHRPSQNCHHHHHHHVQEGLGLISVPCILKMKLVPPSLPRLSYVSSSFWFIL